MTSLDDFGENQSKRGYGSLCGKSDGTQTTEDGTQEHQSMSISDNGWLTIYTRLETHHCCIWVLYMYWHAHDLTQKCKQTAEHSWELQDLKTGHYAVQRAYKSTCARTHTQTLPAANSLWSSGCLPNWDRFVRAVTLASDQHNIFCNMFENVSICTCTLAISWDPWPICRQVRKKNIHMK